MQPGNNHNGGRFSSNQRSSSFKGRHGDSRKQEQCHSRSVQVNMLAPTCNQSSSQCSIISVSDSDSETDGIRSWNLHSSDSDFSSHLEDDSDRSSTNSASTGSGSTGSDHSHGHKLKVDTCIDTLIQSMKNDPVAHYFAGKRALSFVRHELRGYCHALPDARYFVSCCDEQAVALWQLLPEETPAHEFWAGWKRWLTVPLRRWRAMLALEMWYEGHHETAAAKYGPYYYLSYIGTSDACRGKGLGSKLLAHMTGIADSEGRYCALEATSEASCRLYQRHGFEVVEQFRVSGHAPPIFYMVRKPRPAAATAATAAVGMPQPAAEVDLVPAAAVEPAQAAIAA